MLYPKIEEDYAFGRNYNIPEIAKIMYYIVEQYGERFADDAINLAIKEMGAKTKLGRKEVEVQAYTEFMRQKWPEFKASRDARLVRVLLAIVDLKITQEVLLDNHESLNGKESFDASIPKSYILTGGEIAIKCSNRALDRMAFEKKNLDNQKGLLDFEYAISLVIRDLTRMPETLKNESRDPDITRKVRRICRYNMMRLHRAINHLINVYRKIETEIGV